MTATNTLPSNCSNGEAHVACIGPGQRLSAQEVLKFSFIFGLPQSLYTVVLTILGSNSIRYVLKQLLDKQFSRKAIADHTSSHQALLQ